MTDAPVRLLLVDDHAVVRVGLRTLFEKAGYAVVGEAGTRAEAVALAGRLQPDIVIMDLRLPDGSGVEACRDIRSAQPDTRVIVLTSFADEDAVLGAVMAGAAGYLLKQTPPRQLIEAVRTVAAGGSLLDPAVTGIVLAQMQRAGPAAASDPLAEAGLTDQERNVLPLIAEGKTNREIAADLSLSERTVKTYVSRLLQKLQMNRRSEAAAFAARQPPSRSPGE